ncbi:site-specific recombinase XerC [Paucimonas lemoignei]|uniref:Site-specific recombinase XerC n=1 Tax=Paucimonas lemoignei TaxID=29443 RepID=A0A4R3HRX5_PAULE|nr:tyrosine-type recombinase/integrase [Paucimonas lemoignei]TCS33107.1 site-specific recombinase XerC [Paucimonas lemoignei]
MPQFEAAKHRADRAAEVRGKKAYDMQIIHPVDVGSFAEEQRNAIVISSVKDAQGNVVILSRYGDLTWEMWPYVSTPNVKASKKRLCWNTIPESFRESCKIVLFQYWKVGISGPTRTAKPTTLGNVLFDLKTICCHFSKFGLSLLADVQPIHIANFVNEQREKNYRPGTLVRLFFALELLYQFRSQQVDSLQIHPWPDSSAMEMAGWVGITKRELGFEAKTPLIPSHVARCLFLHAENILLSADIVMNERDAGLRCTGKDPEITAIRNACFYLLGVLTGMRSSELSSIEVGAGRTESKNGFTFQWITSIEHKTGKGRVDYLMPSMGHELLRIMERWSLPYRRELNELLATWKSDPAMQRAEGLQAIANAEANRNRLFLGKAKGSVTAVSDTGWVNICRKFARQAGVDWQLSPHQMRRLYAFTFVRHRLGDMLFLKEQFKHSSLDLSRLYAASPYQDVALYDEILDEAHRQKVEAISRWIQSDDLLAGGGGKRIMGMRAHDFPNREALIEETADKLTIRSTGHSWCLAQEEGCGGSGIYERGRCGGCGDSVIDQRFVPIWKEAYRHHSELLEESKTLGPGAQKRVERDLEQAARILHELGVAVEEGQNGTAAA